MKIALVLLLAACKGDGGTSDGGPTGGDDDDDTGPLTDGFEADLTDHGGCSDLLVYAKNADDTAMLSATFDHPLAGAAAEDATIELDLPINTVSIELVQGLRVSDLTCDGTVDGNGSLVTERWRGGAGHVVLVVDYNEMVGGTDPTADVTLTDIRLRPTNTTAELSLPLFEWNRVAVGWEPE